MTIPDDPPKETKKEIEAQQRAKRRTRIHWTRRLKGSSGRMNSKRKRKENNNLEFRLCFEEGSPSPLREMNDAGCRLQISVCVFFFLHTRANIEAIFFDSAQQAVLSWLKILTDNCTETRPQKSCGVAIGSIQPKGSKRGKVIKETP